MGGSQTWQSSAAEVHRRRCMLVQEINILWIAMEDKWGHLVSAAPEVSGNNETITAMILPSRWKKVRKQLDV